MKRDGCLVERIAEHENLCEALGLAMRGHHRQRTALPSGSALQEWLARLQQDILDGTVAVSSGRRFVIHDPKRRTIHAPPFRERVLHHAIMNVAGPRLERLQIADSFASRRGRGVHAARLRARQFCQRFGWHLKSDVRSYFDSIDHDVLMTALARLFKDRRLLALIARIVRAYETVPGRGLPIGSLVSQHAANAYLAPLDRLVKEHLRARGYVRYMDDFVLWHDSPETLLAWSAELTMFLSDHLRLHVKDHPRVGRSRDGLEFLGARVTPVAIYSTRRARRRLLRKLRACEAAHGVGRIDGQELQRRGGALVAALAHTRSLAWRRRTLPARTGVWYAGGCCGPRATSGSTGAVPGTTTPGTAAPRTGTGGTLPTGTTTSASVSPQLTSRQEPGPDPVRDRPAARQPAIGSPGTGSLPAGRSNVPGEPLQPRLRGFE